MKDKKISNVAAGTLSTIMGAICWGFSGFCCDFMFSVHHMSPLWVTPVRMILTSLLLYIICFITYGWRKTLEPLSNRYDLIRVIFFGAVGLSLAQYPYLMAISYSNAATATILEFLGVSYLVVFVCIRQKRLPKKFESWALICALIGTFLITTHGDFSSLIITKAALFWGILSGIGIAVYTLLPVRLLCRYNSMILVCNGMLFAGITMSLICRPWKYTVSWDKQTILPMAALIIIGSVFAFSFYMYGINKIGPVKASMLNTLEPLSAIVFCALFLHLRLHLLDYLGFLFILSTIFILKLDKEKQIKTENSAKKAGIQHE